MFLPSSLDNRLGRVHVLVPGDTLKNQFLWLT
jgi:hypothetical protein